MANAQQMLDMLQYMEVVKSSDLVAVGDLVDSTAGAGIVGVGEEAAGKAVATESLEAVGTLVGIDGLGAALGPIGLAGLAAKQVYDQAAGVLEMVTQESDQQDFANEALYDSTKNTSAIGNTRAVEAVKEFNFGLEQAGYKESSEPGSAGDANGIGKLKADAEDTIRNAFAKEDADTRLTREFERVEKNAAPDSPMSEARAEAVAEIARATKMPDEETTVEGYTVHNFKKDDQLAEGRGELEKAQQEIDRNSKRKIVLEKELDRATDETAKARIRMNEAEDAVKAALKNATVPGGDPSHPSGPQNSAQSSQALQQLWQQQNSANQTLTSLLEANRKSAEEQTRLLQQIVINEAEFEAQLKRLRAQLENIYSCGMH